MTQRRLTLLTIPIVFVSLTYPFVTAHNSSATAPVITAVVNGASFLPGVAPSAWITIWGDNLSATTRTWGDADFANNALPAALDGVSATVNGVAAYIYYISPTQLNVLVPDNATPGDVQVQVTNASGASNTFAVNETQVSPAFFQVAGKYAAAVHDGGVSVGKPGLISGGNFAPARPNETLMLFGTGFGPTNPPLPAGLLVAQAAPLANTTTVTIGGKQAAVTYAGRTGAGLDQLNVTIPPDLPEGDAMVVAQVSGASTQPDLWITIGPAWKIVGPGGGGSMFHPTISPHDPSLAVLNCDMTGAYITKDGGGSWREFNLRTTIGAFAFDPVHPNIVYAGSDGVFRSEDRGETWRLVFPDPKTAQDRMVGDHADHSFYSTDPIWPGDGTQVQAIRVDPDDADRVYVAMAQWGAPRLYYTLDGGRTWRASAAFGNQNVLNLFIDPASRLDSRRLVMVTDANIYSVDVMAGSSRSFTAPAQAIRDAAGAKDPNSTALWLYVTTGEGVWKSLDGGQHWQPISSLRSFAPGYTKITAAERDPRILYIGADPDTASGAEYGILKSTDGGDSWVWVHHVQNWHDPANKVLGWLDRDLPGWAGPPYGLGTNATGQVCYATDSGTAYRTLDGGATWEAVYSTEHPDGTSTSRGLDVTTNYGVHFDPFNKDHLVISYTDIGLFDSINGGASWKRIVKGLGIPDKWSNTCYWLAFDPEIKNRAWSVWSGAHDLPRPKMFKTPLAQYYVGGVCRTDDPGMQWQSCSADLGATTHVIVDPKSPAGNRTLYVTTFGNSGLGNPVKPGGVFKSTDDGRRWMLKTNGMSGSNRNGWRLVQSPDGTLYVLIARGLVPGTNVQLDGAIYKSTDGAEHWQPVRLPAGSNAPNDLAIDPANPTRMYLACWPQDVNGTNLYGGLFITGDSGATWRLAFSESPHVYGVALDPGNPSTVFINTFDGAAYRSDDMGATWRRLGGYNFKWGHRPVPDPVNKGMLYLTTFGSSVWHGPAAGVPGAFEDVYPF